VSDNDVICQPGYGTELEASGRCWFSVKSWEAAARCYRRCRDTRKAVLRFVIECKAQMAKKSKAWQKAAALWRRIDRADRAAIAQAKAIDAIADPISRGYALLKIRKYEQARDAFGSAGYNKGIVQTEALVCEKDKNWKQAADLWQSIGDRIRCAAAMGHAAASRQDWLEAARWYGLAGHRTLAAEAERAARRALRHEQAALF